MDTKFVITLSDLLINLSAGWFGAAIIVPVVVKRFKPRLIPSAMNIALGIAAFAVAFILRKLV